MNFNRNIFVLLLTPYHFLIAICAYFFSKHNISDARYYWFISQDSEKFIEYLPLPFREYLISYINYFFAIILGLPFWCGFVLYSSIGFLGIYFLSRSITYLTIPYSIFYFYILFLPSMHFWTGMIGKEPIVFLAISMIFYTLLNFKTGLNLVIGFILIMLIRPHVALILGLAITMAYILKKKKINFNLIVGFLFISIISLYILLNSHWLAGLSLQDFEQLFHTHHQAFKKTNTYVPLEEYNIFYKIFTFYFRPLPFEINNIFGWVMGIENLISLFITFVGIIALSLLVIKYEYKPSIFELSTIFFFVLLAAVLTLAYSNFGLISRMKNQSQPFLLMLSLHWITLYYNRKQI